MKISLITLAVAATLSVGAFGAGQALATTAHQTAPKTLKVVMHDPGCHWFQVGHKLTTKARLTGRVKLVNFDETALKIVSRHSMHRIARGKSLVVGRGSYVIMMVGQATDDNYLRLTVR